MSTPIFPSEKPDGRFLLITPGSIRLLGCVLTEAEYATLRAISARMKAIGRVEDDDAENRPVSPQTRAKQRPDNIASGRRLIGYGDCRCILSRYCDGTCQPIFEEATC